VEPLAPSRYKIQFTASAELHDKIERLAALMPGADLVSIMEGPSRRSSNGSRPSA